MEVVKCCPNCFSGLDDFSKPCFFCRCGEFTRTNPLALPLNIVLKKRYVAGRVLGAGGFGITYKCFDMQTKKICALKEYVPVNCAMRVMGQPDLTVNKTSGRKIYDYGKDKFLNEAATLRQLRDIPDVVDIWDCFEENGTAYFVMEYLDGVTLNQLRKAYGGRMPFKDACEIILRAADCLERIHEEGNIFHRDISPENIMLPNANEVKIIDFGTAKYIHNKKSQTLSVVLKPGYAPPEQYSTTSKQGAFTDVYALAATMYITLTGQKLPPAPDRMPDGYFKPLEEYTFLGEKYRGLTKTLQKALRVKSNERIQTMGEFSDALRKDYEELCGYSAPPKKSRKPLPVKPPEPPGGGGKGTKKTVLVEHVEQVHPYLLGLRNPIRGYRYDIPVNMAIAVGRSSKKNNIVIPLKSVSNEHLELFYSTVEGIFILRDKGSTNHTYINGRRCKPKEIYPAQPGSILSLAEGVCEFQLGIDK